MADNKKSAQERPDPAPGESPAGGNYDPGGMAGKSIGEEKGDEPAVGNPGPTSTPGGKGKQDAPQNQKR